MMGTRSGSVEIIEFCIEYADTEACVQIAWVIMTFCIECADAAACVRVKWVIMNFYME